MDHSEEDPGPPRSSQNPYGNDNDMSSDGDDSYSGSDLDDDSFASESSDDGIVAQDNRKHKSKVAAKEHQRVVRARIFVLMLLAITAVLNAVIVYFFTLNQEKKDYDTHYDALADEIMQVIGENVRAAYVGMDAMSDGLTTRVTQGSEGTLTWPLVTFSNYPEFSSDVRNVTGALQIIHIPIVEESERTEWEQYSSENNDWVLVETQINYEERRYRTLLEKSNNTHPFKLGSSSLVGFQPDFLEEFGAADDVRYPTPEQQRQQRPLSKTKAEPKQRQLQAAGHAFRNIIPERIHPAPNREQRLTSGMKYAPVWQMSPVPYYYGIINHDMFHEPSFQVLNISVIETRQAVLSDELHNALVDLFVEEHNPLFAELNSGTDNNNNGDNERNGAPPPVSVMVQPVWEHLDKNPSLVGFQIALIPWDSYLINTFRPTKGESVLIQYDYSEYSSCNLEVEDSTSFSSSDETARSYENYRISGGDAVDYLGPGEDGFLEQDRFDYSMKRTTNFPVDAPPPGRITLLQADGNTSGIPWPPPPPAAPECRRLRVNLYPSDELRSVYMTQWPGIYAGLIIIVFIILTAAFVIYDFSVERRRGKVMAVAEKTSRIVTSLFPTHFADQLIKDNKKKEKEAKKRRKKVVLEEAPTRQLKKYMKDKDKKYKKLNSASNGRTNGSSNTLGYGQADPSTADDSPLFLAQSKPIADLFPETTVLFTDVVGFTAWSSVREPSQVFTLLETVYASFDFLAKQYGIFKIETIGDCYVAVCGLPEPRVDHAVAMSRFAQACMTKMKEVVSQLEVTLGPDTGDLALRFGLHSGPVTAGILRGERARFQLFGDTVNTAARMESTGMKDKIQISQETADLLVVAGKTHWFVKRDGLVKAKGKGELQTYWLVAYMKTGQRQSIGGAATSEGRRTSIGTPSARRGSMSGRRNSLAGRAPSTRNLDSQSNHSNTPKQNPALLMGAVLTKKEQRLVDWNCELLQQLLRQIVARRNFVKNASRRINAPFTAMMSELPKIGGMIMGNTTNVTPLSEVVEVINLPEFDVAAYHSSTDAKHITLSPSVVTQLRRYVTILASKYRDNPFHNFDHASHVAMSVSKLLTRIIAPDLASINARHEHGRDDINSSLHLASDMKDLHDHTYGITSDPLTQFGVVLSALIHDVDHRGVPNSVLCSEEPQMAAKYDNKSVAEQNSVDIAWEILMDEGFKALRDTICGEYIELRRLRALVVNSVMATDIFDKDLSALRKARWNKAFMIDQPEPPPTSSLPPLRRLGTKQSSSSFHGFGGGANLQRAENNRKATIVIEHLIQASDVAHTMQHWHIYTRWNECLFKEMYTSFQHGRVDKDPSEGWYKGEIWFFDNYVIPLAKKLKECGVFGVSSDEYLDYATANRNEWEEKGEGIVAEMLLKYKPVVERAALGYE